MSQELNSVRMRAGRGGQHISGAERLVPFAEVEQVALAMLERALTHPRGPVEKIHLSIDPVEARQVEAAPLPDLYPHCVETWQQGRELARQLLTDSQVAATAVDKAIAALARGAAPDGSSMRGAMLIDALSGQRLEPDQARGVRVSRMDLDGSVREQLQKALAAHRLNNPHVIEALTLAAKVISCPAVVAELCWSDDPDYVAGYVASKSLGYRRINRLKPAGEERGGRSFFIRSGAELSRLIAWLEGTPLLIDRLGRICPATGKGNG